MMTLTEFGKKLEKLNEAYEQLRKKYQKPEVGNTVEVAGIKWLVLDKLEKGYLVISEDFYGEYKAFDNSKNDWKTSNLRNYLNTKLKKEIEEDVGQDALVKFDRDLTSMDGQTEYGICEDYVSIITFDEYRKYRKLLPNTGEYWWTLTPDSTTCNDDSQWVRVVSQRGDIYFDVCNFNFGVRPVCIFSSSIFGSE
jgi:hypothetical protein